MVKPIERLKRKVLKENMWVFILSLLKNKPSYRYEIKDLIKEKFGFVSGNVTAYKVLFFLEAGKYVESFEKNNKKYYNITNLGKKELKLAEKFLDDVKKMIKK